MDTTGIEKERETKHGKNKQYVRETRKEKGWNLYECIE
jgi:hypothetical protein